MKKLPGLSQQNSQENFGLESNLFHNNLCYHDINLWHLLSWHKSLVYLPFIFYIMKWGNEGEIILQNIQREIKKLLRNLKG